MERFSAGPSTLILSHHTMRHAPFDERVAAAAAAGYDGIGINIRAYRELRAAGRSDDELLDILGQHGQQIAEVEALSGWSAAGDQRDRSEAAADVAFHLADVFGVFYLQSVGPYEGSIGDAAKAFAALCDRAADHGLVVGLEFLPFTNVPDITTALRVVEGADRDNGGICVDSWHFTRGDDDWEALAAMPGDRVLDIQINDGPLVAEHPDYLEDCITNRRLPGEGEFDLVRFIRTLDEAGTTAPVSVEIISAALDELPAAEVAQRSADATRRVLAAARG